MSRLGFDPRPTVGQNRLMNKHIVPLLLLLALVSVAAHAAIKVNLIGTLADDAGNPYQGFQVTIAGAGVEETAKTDKKGRFKVSLPDSEAEYEIRFEREGVLIHSEALKFDPRGGTQRREWSMNVTPAGSATDSMAALDAFNAGDLEETLERLGLLVTGA